MNEQQTRAINRVINAFDFERVHRAMQAVEWVWQFDGGVRRTPTVAEMMDTVRELAADMFSGGSRGMATGGFYLNQTPYEEGRYLLELSFSVEDASTELDPPGL